MVAQLPQSSLSRLGSPELRTQCVLSLTAALLTRCHRCGSQGPWVMAMKGIRLYCASAMCQEADVIGLSVTKQEWGTTVNSFHR